MSCITPAYTLTAALGPSVRAFPFKFLAPLLGGVILLVMGRIRPEFFEREVLARSL